MPPTDPIVQIDSGRLSATSGADGVTAFKGIPYAKPPIGDLRWRAPQPPEPWAGVRRADTFGPRCVQPLRRETYDERALRNFRFEESLDRLRSQLDRADLQLETPGERVVAAHPVGRVRQMSTIANSPFISTVAMPDLLYAVLESRRR